MQIKESIISNGHGGLNPGYLVIHETANPGATALNHVSYWSRDDTYAVHYVNDWNGIVYHCVRDDRLCWHVGNGNGYCVGIELGHAITPQQFKQVWDCAVEFAAWYLKKRGWGIERMISHDEAARRWGGSDHTDPIGYFAQFGRSWGQFKDAVAAAMKEKAVRKQEPGKPVNSNMFRYRSHVQQLGWLDPVRDGQVSGTTGNGFQMEAFKVTPPDSMVLDIKAHLAGIGWKTWKGIQKGKSSGTGSSDNDPIIGTTGKKRALQAFEIDIVKNPKNYKVSYRVHVSGYGWGPWIKAGYTAGTTGIDKAIEAIQIKAE